MAAAFDPHKWFYAPPSSVKDERSLTASFGMKPSCPIDELDQAGERYQYYVHGFEQYRRFRSLKVWMTFRRYGSARLGDWVDNNVRQAAHLYALVSQRPDFEAASRPPMSAVCIRFRGAALSENDAKQLHTIVVERVERSGKFWISTTELKGKT
jgi:aromatic-L-amino-acid/L-tryptophan decarboxylase